MEITLDCLHLWGHVTGTRHCLPSPIQPPPKQPISALPAEDEAAKEANAVVTNAADEAFQYATDTFEHWCADEACVRAILAVSIDDSIQPNIVGLHSTHQI